MPSATGGDDLHNGAGAPTCEASERVEKGPTAGIRRCGVSGTRGTPLRRVACRCDIGLAGRRDRSCRRCLRPLPRGQASKRCCGEVHSRAIRPAWRRPGIRGAEPARVPNSDTKGTDTRQILAEYKALILMDNDALSQDGDRILETILTL